MTIRVDLSSGISRIQVFGHVTWDDFRDALTTMIEHPDFHAGMNALWDIRAADLSQSNSEDLLRFGELVIEHTAARDGARGALAIPGEEDHGLSKIFDTLREVELPVHVRVFRDLAEATAWLAPSGASD